MKDITIEEGPSSEVSIHINNDLKLTPYGICFFIFELFVFIGILKFVILDLLYGQPVLMSILLLGLASVATWILFAQLREFLISHKGEDELTLTESLLLRTGRYGFLRKKDRFKLSQISTFHLAELDMGEYKPYLRFMYSDVFGKIIIGKSRVRRLVVGRSLEQEELTLLYQELKKKIPPSNMPLSY